MNTTIKQAVTINLSDVVTAINAGESLNTQLINESAKIKTLAVNTAKSVSHASALVWGYCQIVGNTQAQICNALGGRTAKSTVSRYFNTGAIQAKLGTDNLIKAGITPNAISTALSQNLSAGELAKCASVSQVKRLLTPKHPTSAKRKAKPNAKAQALVISFQNLEDKLSDMALAGRVTFEQLEKLAKRVHASIKLAEQKKN